ncbi:IS630 family transposase [Leptolyngbya sp. 15MV]|nr:IS630 family transposase [Leptolyngbya sp. 15MV]
MARALPAEAKGKPLEIWFQDEARIGQQGTLTRIWAKRGSRPRAPRDQRYNWAYLFGAACPGRGLGAAIVVPEANAATMNLHLDAISRAVSPQAHAAVLLDGAGYHKSRNLRVPSNITLIRLPRYAPELNSAENIWEYLRKNKLSNTVFDSYDDIVDKACQAWLFFANDKATVTSVTARPWATVTS